MVRKENPCITALIKETDKYNELTVFPLTLKPHNGEDESKIVGIPVPNTDIVVIDTIYVPMTMSEDTLNIALAAMHKSLKYQLDVVKETYLERDVDFVFDNEDVARILNNTTRRVTVSGCLRVGFPVLDWYLYDLNKYTVECKGETSMSDLMLHAIDIDSDYSSVEEGNRTHMAVYADLMKKYRESEMVKDEIRYSEVR